MKDGILKGRIWVIRDIEGKSIDDIDTDMIFHNAHLAITDIEKMGQHAFGNLQNWKDFPAKAEEGDIIVVGQNFGAGSSRQQAVDCFAALGIKAIIGESFGAIYKRNAINSGFPLVTCPEVMSSYLKNGDIIELDLMSGRITSDSVKLKADPLSRVQMDIYKAGSLFAYGKKL